LWRIFYMSLAFSEFYSRYEQPNYNQSLWNVDHTEFHKPGERFLSDTSHYIEAIAESSRGPLQDAKVPRGMVKFAQYFLDRLQVTGSRFVSIEDVAHGFLTYMDYSEPYYLFSESCVELVPNQLTHSYRFRKKDGTAGSTLDPKKIECFQVKLGFTFPAYRECMKRITHPATEAIVSGGIVPHPQTGAPMTKQDILFNLSQITYGSAGIIESWVEDWVFDFYQSIEYSEFVDELEQRSLESIKAHDILWWQTVVTSFLIWIKSEHALPFLCDFHPIFSSILGWDPQRGQPYILPGSGGEAVVCEWDIYTHMHLIVEEQKPPGSCDNCKLPLHCTKLVNVTAIQHPLCSCGKLVDIEDVELLQHSHYSSDGPSCYPYRKEHQPLDAFGCQRCLSMLLKNRPADYACDHSPHCPNTNCNWHGGKGMYLKHLTDRRRMMLTHQRPQ
jgi:hypothetical protein